MPRLGPPREAGRCALSKTHLATDSLLLSASDYSELDNDVTPVEEQQKVQSNEVIVAIIEKKRTCFEVENGVGIEYPETPSVVHAVTNTELLPLHQRLSSGDDGPTGVQQCGAFSLQRLQTNSFAVNCIRAAKYNVSVRIGYSVGGRTVILIPCGNPLRLEA